MKYFISYVLTSNGGMHDHHTFGNDFLTTEKPITGKDIRDFEAKLITFWKCRANVLSFQKME